MGFLCRHARAGDGVRRRGRVRHLLAVVRRRVAVTGEPGRARYALERVLSVRTDAGPSAER
ncbi:hypothetical protein SGLAM104S_01145 [Streptomyces glaucescens]